MTMARTRGRRAWGMGTGKRRSLDCKNRKIFWGRVLMVDCGFDGSHRHGEQRREGLRFRHGQGEIEHLWGGV